MPSQFGGVAVDEPQSSSGSRFGGIPVEEQDQSKTDMFDTVSDNALQGSTFGIGNRAESGLAALVASGINGKPISENYQTARDTESGRLSDEMKQHPVASVLSNIGGALATGKLAANALPGASAAIANSLRSGGTAARIAKGSLAGATTGAAYGAGTADYDKTLEGAEHGAAMGALTGGALPAAGAALSDVGNTVVNAGKGLLAKSPEAVQDIAGRFKSTAGDIYDQMRQVGATLNPNATNTLIKNIDNAVSSKQFIPALNPKTLAVVEHIKQASSNGELGLSDLDQYRRLLGKIGPTEDGVSATQVRSAIDNTVNSLGGKDLTVGTQVPNSSDLHSSIDEWGKLKELERHLTNTVNGTVNFAANNQSGFWKTRSITEAAQDAKNLNNVKQQILTQEDKIKQIETAMQAAPQQSAKLREAVDLLNQGRRQYQQASKFEDVSDILTKADGDPNKIKSGLTRFLNNENNTRGWSDAEKAALKNAASGSGTEKLLKMFGKFGFDPGNSLTMGNTVAPVIGGAVGGLGAPVGGTIARVGQKLAARGKAQNLLDTLQNGGSKGLPSKPVSGLFSAPASEIQNTINRPQTGNIGEQNIQQLQQMKQAMPATPIAPQSNNSPDIAAFAKAESGNNPNAKNPNSTASGLLQFTNKTWADMVNRYGKQTGIDLKDKNNPQAQATMAQLYAQDNIKSLQNTLGRLPTKGELYMAHVLGANGAAKLINADPNKEALMLFPRQVFDANRPIFFNGRNPRSAGEVYQILNDKVS